MFTQKDKIDVLIEQQNKKIKQKAALKSYRDKTLNKIERAYKKLDMEKQEVMRITEYKLTCLEEELFELEEIIKIKAKVNSTKKPLED